LTATTTSFPYPTLFRSPETVGAGLPGQRNPAAVASLLLATGAEERRVLAQLVRQLRVLRQAELLTLVQVGRAGQGEHQQRSSRRSEEHTSELQSRFDLV